MVLEGRDSPVPGPRLPVNMAEPGGMKSCAPRCQLGPGTEPGGRGCDFPGHKGLDIRTEALTHKY